MTETDIVELVKQKNPIEDVVEGDGFPLPKSGLYRKCKTKGTGGLVINVNMQCYYWNTRAESGDVISWVMKRKNCDFKAAVELLAARAGLPAPNWGHSDPAARLASRMREEALDVAQRVFVRWLHKSTAATAYVKRRGWSIWEAAAEEDSTEEHPVPKPGTVVSAMLGFSGVGTAAEREEMKRELTAAGINLESPAAVAILGYKGDVVAWARRHDVVAHDKWLAEMEIPGIIGWGMLTYPHVRNGRVVYLSTRAIARKFHYNLPKELVGDRQLFFNQVYGSKSANVVVVEGQADAVTLGQWGFEGVALAGVAVGSDLADQLKGHQVQYIGLDADAAGSKNGPKVAAALGPLSRMVRWGSARRAMMVLDGDKTRRVQGADDLVGAMAQARARGDDLPGAIADLLQLMPVITGERGFSRAGYHNQAGQLVEITNATELLRGIEQLQADEDTRAGFVRQLVRELLDWAPAYLGEDDEGRRVVRDVKDANDLLKGFGAAGLGDEEQKERVQELLDQARTWVETVCEAVQGKDGATRDAAQRDALEVVADLEKLDNGIPYAQYRSRLAKSLGMTVREMAEAIKRLAAAEKAATSEGEPIYTWGGLIAGHVIEYLYDIETDRASLAWRDPQGQIGSGESLTIEGRTYKPYPVNETLRQGAIAFPAAVGERKSIRELVAYVELYLRSIYLMPSDKVARLISYWVLSTWIYDAFETCIYLRAMGGAGSGKSELMRRIGMVCYRTMTANGAGSTSSLFRAVERYKGAVLLDEADLQASDTEQDMIKFYNLGAMRGNPIWRTVEIKGPDGGRDFEERSFQTFCPKLIAMRKEFADDAVGTRSLTLKLVPREMMELRAANIPLTVNQAIRTRAQALRNLLLRWRLETWQSEIEVDPELYDMTISARLNQVAGPLLAIAQDDPEQQEDIRRTLREYYAETILTQSMTLQARVIEAMWKIWNMPDLHKDCVKVEADGSQVMKIGDITKITNDIINEMNDEEGGDDEEDGKKNRSREVKSQRIGRIIRNELQLQVSSRRRDGFWTYWNEPRMLGLSNKFGINPADFGPNLTPDPSPAGEGKRRQGNLA
jgi:hypothetical protein